MTSRLYNLFLLAFLLILAGCANQTTPTGGKKDVTAPRLLSVTPVDSLRNTRVKKIELAFDEYITLNDAIKEVQISPILLIQPTATGSGKKVTIKIVDSLLEDNTTYRISLGTAVRDLHENNPFPNYTYTFSTGAYFDSLTLQGNVQNAAIGLPDTSGIFVVLYGAKESDSAIVRHKPKYITRADGKGHFMFKGLPRKTFRIYALHDGNDNLMYDKGTEMIAFTESKVTPGDTLQKPILLRLFEEAPDTGFVQKSSSTGGRKGMRGDVAATPATDTKTTFSYTVAVDTGTGDKRTFDVTKPLTINFTGVPSLTKDKITLTYDSSGVAVTQSITVMSDSATSTAIHIQTQWKENTVYTLRLAKGFARDSAGTEVMPSKYTFHTKEDEDYGKITLHLPAKYANNGHLLQIIADKDTIYQKPITDTTVSLAKLKPTKYVFRVIADKNGNGKWDTGNLFLAIQPEEVFPYIPGELYLKPGWDNTIDFEQTAQNNPKGKR